MVSLPDSFLFRALKRRAALIGLGVIVFFILVATIGAAAAPQSNGYSPSQFDIASPNALPIWMSIVPGFQNQPPNITFPPSTSDQSFKTSSAVAAWQPTQGPQGEVQYAPSAGPTGMTPAGRAYELVNTGQGSELINMSGDSQGTMELTFQQTFSYKYLPPGIFMSQVAFDPAVVQGAGVAVMLYVQTSKGVYPTALEANQAGEAVLESGKSGLSYLSYFTNPIIQAMQNDTWNYVGGATTAAELMPLAYLNSSLVSGLSVSTLTSTIFKGVSSYTLGETVMIFPQGQYKVQLYQSDLKYELLGNVYGLLGTDTNGADVWSEFSHGTQYALLIAFGAAAITLVIGILVGLVAGFFGGLVDSALLLVIDFLILIPGLVLLVDLDTVFTLAHLVTNKALLLIIIFGILSWPILARTLRSQVLSLRSTTYVVSAGAMGGGKLYVLRRHILNHTFGTIIAIATFLIAGFVILDVGVDYLGLGITQTPTWGNMVAALIVDVSPANSYLWWITLPLSLSIILVSMSFWLVGYSIQREYSRTA